MMRHYENLVNISIIWDVHFQTKKIFAKNHVNPMREKNPKQTSQSMKGHHSIIEAINKDIMDPLKGDKCGIKKPYLLYVDK